MDSPAPRCDVLDPIIQRLNTPERRLELAQQRKQQIILERFGNFHKPMVSNEAVGPPRSRGNSNEQNEDWAAAANRDSPKSRIPRKDSVSRSYELRNGRRYLAQNLPYPLPVDLLEMQRQDLRTLLDCKAFGRPIRSPNFLNTAPTKVLEIGCGSGYWSSLCHEHFSYSLGHNGISFTGLDIAPLAADLRRQGVDWKFVQHDLRRVPLPFADEQFDLVMVKDLSLVVPLGLPWKRFIDESIRVLKGGGTLEIWETDHVLRSLLPHPPWWQKDSLEGRLAQKTTTVPIASRTPFASAQNQYLQDVNAWIQMVLDKRKLPDAPCARIHSMLLRETDDRFSAVGAHRVAIPFASSQLQSAEMDAKRSPGDRHDSVISNGGSKASALTPEQAALRQTALLTTVQMIESLEPLLKEVSGKNAAEWDLWRTSMMDELLDSRVSLNECLEIGAWWATKAKEE